MRKVSFFMLGIFLLFQAEAAVIVNGDFESGNSGFSYDYVYDVAVDADNEIGVVNTIPNGWAPGFGDHTSGFGNMLVVNGAANANNYYWGQSIDVVAGLEYTFSGWVADLTQLPHPVIQLRVDGIQVGSTYTPNAFDEWQSFSMSWTAASTESVELRLHTLETAAIGNDFAIDDLSISDNQVVPEPSTLALTGFALMGILGLRRWRQGTA